VQMVLFKLAIGLTAVLILLNASLFVVQQTEQALVVQFGEIKRTVKEPGLHAKVPFIQDLIMFDKRILEFETRPEQFVTRNQETDVEERVVIDAFVRYRITDPVQFFLSVKNEANFSARLNGIVLAGIRGALSGNSLGDLLSTKRAEIMKQIKANVNAQMVGAVRDDAAVVEAPRGGFGVEVVDVRIVRADLPPEIYDSTFERMRKDFTKEAQRFRAEGEEVATEIRATADRERTEILANARKTAEITRGEGDAIATKTYAEAFGRDPEFFKFYRAMQAYRATLSRDDTTIVLSPEDGFLSEFKQ
jgi:membrane protease subunit HflC